MHCKNALFDDQQKNYVSTVTWLRSHAESIIITNQKGEVKFIWSNLKRIRNE